MTYGCSNLLASYWSYDFVTIATSTPTCTATAVAVIAASIAWHHLSVLIVMLSGRHNNRVASLTGFLPIKTITCKSDQLEVVLELKTNKKISTVVLGPVSTELYSSVWYGTVYNFLHFQCQKLVKVPKVLYSTIPIVVTLSLGYQAVPRELLHTLQSIDCKQTKSCF